MKRTLSAFGWLHIKWNSDGDLWTVQGVCGKRVCVGWMGYLLMYSPITYLN